MSRGLSARRFGVRRGVVLLAGFIVLAPSAFAEPSRGLKPPRYSEKMARYGESSGLRTQHPGHHAQSVSPAATDPDHLSRTIPLPPDTPIRIAVTEGSVTVMGEARSDLSVEIVRRAANGKSAAALPLVVEQTADGIHISALQASDETHLGHDPDLQATVTVHVPLDAEIAAIDVFEGRIELTNLRGHVTAEITRGPIQATRLTGRVRLTGHVGDVTVEQAELPADGLLRLRTFNGTVRLALAVRPANARVLAVTFNGHVSSNLPLEMKDQFGPTFGETTLGSGEPLISIDVVTGDIRITAPAS